MKTVYFIRHGQAESNVSGIRDPEAPLTLHGRTQADFIADRMRHTPIEVVLASTMQRAYETGKRVAEEKGVPLEEFPLARERRYATSTYGIPKDHATRTAFDSEWKEHVADAAWHFEDEENIFDLVQRARELLGVLSERDESSIAVVSHANILRTTLAVILLGDLFVPEHYPMLYKTLRLSNTGVTVAELSDGGEWRVVTVNDHAHLADSDLPRPA